MPGTESVAGPIAVLVVHGIGAQEPGEGVGKLLAGLDRVQPGSAAQVAHAGMCTVGGQLVRLYEVYWADLLKGGITHGAFQMNELQSLSWFPWFNLWRGNYRNGGYSFLTLLRWCVVLPIVNFFVLFAYYGAGLVTQIVSSVNESRTEAKVRGTLWQVAREKAEKSAKLTMLDRILDEYVGDVLSYINSAGKAFHREADEPSVPPEFEHVYAKIVQRFYDQLIKAQADGCSTIQIVAHSLGTVVAYHALSGLCFNDEARDDAQAIRAASVKVRHLYTIGSPLEKVRFFWPRLIPAAASLGGVKVGWDNFASWFDPVAGKLRQFGAWTEVSNHRLLGGGFIRGHVVYEHSPVFLRAFTRGLCGHEIPFTRTSKERWQDFFLLIGETLLAPTALAIVLIFGAALFVSTVLLLPFLLSLVLRQFLPDEIWAPITDTGSLIFGTVLFIALLLAPLIRASKVHARYWAASPVRPGAVP